MKTNFKLKAIVLLLMVFASSTIFAHNVDYSNQVLRNWTITKENKTIRGSFSMYKDGKVFIEDANSNLVSFPLQYFSTKDQAFVLNRFNKIKEINNQLALDQHKTTSSFFDSKFWIVLSILISLTLIAFFYYGKEQFKYLAPVIAVGVVMGLFSFTKKAAKALQSSSTSVSFLDSAFAPFRPNVNTYTDPTYYYVESKGIPTTHTMMVGISNHGWQRQVPIPQCYIGANAWPIPLNPVVASVPVPVNPSHFSRGAIAVAVNGIAIFNPYTNTGVDAFLDGQLDNYGGHCGRADDYHYHTAPLHLYGTTSATLPIAFGLDGFAVYGSVEPDGSAMTTLDANHGHYGTNGVYHYHGSAAAPYMIANMVGQVTEDATHQIIPQAQAHPIRVAQSPLAGALITACNPNSTNSGYTLIYTLSGQTDSIEYHWSGTVYTFNFYTPSSFTDTIYNNGFVQCNVPSAVNELNASNLNLVMYPNPNNGILNIQLSKDLSEKNVQEIAIYNMQGQSIYKTDRFYSSIDIKNLEKGTYLVKVRFPAYQLTKKLSVQ
jgi:Secretion system C-terminal sorting domain/YHYH protein